MGKYFHLGFWDSYDPDDGSIILQRSDDEGDSWWDATSAEDILWVESGIHFFFDKLDDPVWLKLELVGVGDSNTVVLSQIIGLANGGRDDDDRTGGDRNGTDRDDALTQEEDYNKTTGNSNDESTSQRKTSSGGSSGGDIKYTAPVTDIFPFPEDVSKTVEADHSALEPLPAANTVLPLLADEQLEIIETQSDNPEIEEIETQFNQKTEVNEKLKENQYPEVIDQANNEPHANTPLQSDPNQTVPKPGFPIKITTIFFAIASALSCGTMLIMHLYGKQRNK